MRDARNGNEIVRSILQKSGIRIDIITGQQEADIILEAGAGKYTVDPGRNYLYMDVGGGSTEITLISGQKRSNPILSRSEPCVCLPGKSRRRKERSIRNG